MLKIVDLQMASLKGPYPKVVVIGAGVVGLSTALCIQEIIPGVVLTVIADKFENDTLSSGAGGLFRPDNNIGPSSEIFKEWCRDSYNHFMSILKTSDASEAGIQQLSGYHLSSVKQECVQNEILEELVPLLRPVTEEEHKLFPPELKDGMFYTTIVTDCHHYLPWLRKRIQSNGGHIKSKNIQSLEEVAGQFDVVVNCTGLGSKTLLGDKFLIPVRGQVIKVSAPWIKHFYYADDTYIIPGFNYITLGGTKELGNWKTELSSHDRQSIWERCTRLVPSLQKSKVLWEWVGLRPFRQPVRVEKEIRNLNSGKQKVVHNYGHGAHGVSLSWGTAKHAARLVKEILDDPLDFTTYSRL